MTLPPRLSRSLRLAAWILTGAASSGTAQEPHWEAFSAAAVPRISALVDSVYLDRLLPEAVAGPGEFASYLVARLGLRRFPPDLGFLVAADTGHILISGTLSDFPEEARGVLGPMFTYMDSTTTLVAEVRLSRASPRAMRFRLEMVSLGGVAIPEPFLATVLLQVGMQYPALTESGRDLYVEVPDGAGMSLVTNGILLTAPPAGTTPSRSP